MRYNNADARTRFLAYVIDSFILFVISNPIISKVLEYFNYDQIVLEDKLNRFLSELERGFYNMDLVMEIFNFYIINFVVTFLVMIPLICVYFCVIPMFWEKQTIGRLACSVKVVKYPYEGKCSFSRLLLREIIGGYIVTDLLCSGLILLILLIWVTVKKERSFADYIGGTRLISLKDPVPIFTHDEGSNPNINSEEKSSEDDYRII